MTSKDSPIIGIPEVVKPVPVPGSCEEMPDFSGLRRIRRASTWCLWICVAVIISDFAFAAIRQKIRAIEAARRKPALRMKQPQVIGTSGPPAAAKPALLNQAKAIIPEELKQIYDALNGGNPKGAATLLAPAIL